MRRDASPSCPAVTLNLHRSSAKGAGSRSTTKHRNNFCTTREAAKLSSFCPPLSSSQTQRITGLFLEKLVWYSLYTHQMLSSEGFYRTGGSPDLPFASHIDHATGKARQAVLSGPNVPTLYVHTQIHPTNDWGFTIQAASPPSLAGSSIPNTMVTSCWLQTVSVPGHQDPTGSHQPFLWAQGNLPVPSHLLCTLWGLRFVALDSSTRLTSSLGFLFAGRGVEEEKGMLWQ